MKLISQGAEARVYETTLYGDKAILKERFKKQYRHPDLEKRLSKSRLVQEVRCLNRAAKAGICTPAVLFVQVNYLRIYLEFIEGKTLKEFIFTEETKKCVEMCKQLGTIISQLHGVNVTHGDLTTSNAIVRAQDSKVVLIDFGLSRPNSSVEDKAVDLYVLERAFTSTHPDSGDLFQHVLDAYKNRLNEGDEETNLVMEKFVKVQKRGRKRMAFG